MAASVTFTGLETFNLTGIRATDHKLGHGSYATVEELEYMGLKCAGKKIHDLLLEQGDASYTLRRFEEECRLLSQVRHPNIVQFLGVHFQRGVRVPILVMEFLPTNLTSCIEQYGIFPKEIGYSILHDVALGLCYLHSQTPPIIHRDLSSNNVLLTANMTGKISDLGVARILNLTPLQVSRMTQTPGTPAYMPPEVMVANPSYDTSIDMFSYGIMMIHVFSGNWPEPQVGPNRYEGDQLIPVTEAERREVFLQAIGSDHPLMDLIVKCISNNSRHRANAGEVVRRLAVATLQNPSSFPNLLEMLKHIRSQDEEKLVLMEEKEAKINQNVQKIADLREEAQEKDEEFTRQNTALLSEIEQLKIQVRDLKSKNELLETKSKADNKEFKTKVTLFKQQIDAIDKTLKQDREEVKLLLSKEREHSENQLSRERDLCRRLTDDIKKFKAEISQLKQSIDALRYNLSTAEAEKLQKDAIIERSKTELQAQSRALQQSDSIISEMNQQFMKTREHLSSKQQVLQASIIWKQCKGLPTRLSWAKTTVMSNRKVYCGGGATDFPNDFTDYVVYCYDAAQDDWTTLPPLPVRFFGLGQVNDKLVAIGGQKNTRVNEILTYDERSKKWKQTIPPMPTARTSPGVLSLQSALVVAGGITSDSTYTNVVEIFKPSPSQWYTTDPLPTPCCDICLIATGSGGECYALGGYRHLLGLSQVLCASVDDLISNATPANQTAIIDTQSLWKTLVDSPTNRPTASTLSGHLLAVGGTERSVEGADMSTVHVYSPSTNLWLYVSDIPAPLSIPAVAALSPTEILVIGGRYCGGRVNTVYKGILQLKL